MVIIIMLDSKIITIANQKGGCGKTTITMQLAGLFGKDNSVLVVDADPQGTATRWAASADDIKPFSATICGLSAAGSKVHQEAKKYIGKFHYIFIDCPPAIESVVPQSALMISDLVIVPVIPSPADLWAAIGIQRLIERVQDLNEALKARLVINMCQPNINITQETLEVLNTFNVQKFQTNIALRTAYRQSAVFGGTVLDLKGAEKAINEMNFLKEEVIKLLYE